MQGFNKYYPPDYDPNQHTSLNAYRGKHALGDRARKLDQGILITRFELPFNIWCDGCNNHIGMGVRYNAEKKKIGNYFSTPIYSFRCKCHLCDNWFTIETDPKNTRYVVMSGARKKDEDWDPEENGGFAIHNSDPTAGPVDPLAALEKSTDAQKNFTQVQAPRLESLQSLSDHYNTDPYSLSTKVRRLFRQEKKIEAKKKEADDATRGKYALPEDLKLLQDDEQTTAAAKEEWVTTRREFLADEEAKRRRWSAQSAPLQVSSGSSGSKKPADRKRPVRSSLSSLSKPSAIGAASSLRARLLQNKARQSDPFLNEARRKPPESKDIGVLVKR
ncbi:DUF572-domain-containing protein [Rickenella mellea]|uniref:DUF572-domain-containing protein n=1 Tax=Rickenella mellea TaxID=50990 RepID=A0A4Y7QD44_9AGAM|nr:DUF572-domain-containing protein [Rickenella mellea]